MYFGNNAKQHCLQCLYCITVFGLPVSVRDIAPGKQLGDSVLRQPPKWEKKLHLPHPSYPTRMMNTTRHRPLYRSPHSAFMERVETKLTKVWEEERANVNTAPVVTVHRTS